MTTPDNTHYKTLLALGAEVVAGRVYLNREHVADCTPVGVVLTERGTIELATAEVPAPAKKAPAKKTAKKAEEPKAEPTPAPDDDIGEAAIDALLDGITDE